MFDCLLLILIFAFFHWHFYVQFPSPLWPYGIDFPDRYANTVTFGFCFTISFFCYLVLSWGGFLLYFYIFMTDSTITSGFLYYLFLYCLMLINMGWFLFYDMYPPLWSKEAYADDESSVPIALFATVLCWNYDLIDIPFEPQISLLQPFVGYFFVSIFDLVIIPKCQTAFQQALLFNLIADWVQNCITLFHVYNQLVSFFDDFMRDLKILVSSNDVVLETYLSFIQPLSLDLLFLRGFSLVFENSMYAFLPLFDQLNNLIKLNDFVFLENLLGLYHIFSNFGYTEFSDLFPSLYLLGNYGINEVLNCLDANFLFLYRIVTKLNYFPFSFSKQKEYSNFVLYFSYLDEFRFFLRSYTKIFRHQAENVIQDYLWLQKLFASRGTLQKLWIYQNYFLVRKPNFSLLKKIRFYKKRGVYTSYIR